MREFESLVYMDQQKTGSTSIVAFLRAALREQETPHGVHSYADKGHDTSKFHFASVRHPVSLYVSLFSYGVSGRGGLLRALQRRGFAEKLYQPSIAAFNAWVEFMLEPKNIEVIGKKYAEMKIGDLCGPLSQRLLMLSFVDPIGSLSAQDFAGKDDLIRYFGRERIYDHYVRTEHLVPDLLEIWNIIKPRVRIKQSFENVSTVEDLKAAIPRRNVGDKVEGLSRDTVPAELQARIREREWLIYDLFGYDESKGAPSPLPPKSSDAAQPGA